MTRSLYIPASAPFNAEQRAWLNGFLAAWFVHQGLQPLAAAAQTPDPPRKPLLILYGSQSGNSEMLARRFGNAASPRGFEPRVLGMDQCATLNLAAESTWLVVISTWGDGDVPDNAKAFWSHLNSPQAPKLDRIHFAVLALGDTTYETTFCQAGKNFDRRLEELGARRLAARVDCSADFESGANQWAESVWRALEGPGNPTRAAACTGGSVVQPPAPARPGANGTDGFGRQNPFPARLLKNCRLTGPRSNKDTRHLEIALADSGLAYEVGDALGVLPTNAPALVDGILEKLRSTGEESVTGREDAAIPLRRALLHDYEINKLSATLLRSAAERCPKAGLDRLLAADSKDALEQYLWGRDVLDLLCDFPDLRFSPADFIGLLRKLAPRLYSIASSPKAHPGEVHLTVGPVRFESLHRARGGVCSTFLADRVDDDTSVSVFVQAAPSFRLPADPAAPVIMVGPGTGIAPFRAFLEERAATGAPGPNWLFFGEQQSASDFFYREELETMRERGILTRLDTAFSRDQADKIYVQHRMRDNGGELWRWWQDGAYFYVCGDARRMAKDVDAALHEVAEKAGGLSREDADDYVAKLKMEKRYRRDVY
ncbi:MAG: sulfite reductase subunit alpha [Limisphaerales bacterium]